MLTFARAFLQGRERGMANQRSDWHTDFPSDAGLQSRKTLEIPQRPLDEVLIAIECSQVRLVLRTQLEADVTKALTATWIVIVLLDVIELQFQRLQSHVQLIDCALRTVLGSPGCIQRFLKPLHGEL
ncbi:hypothetical protein P350_24145 [Burkholderia cepacia JBK9]|nr:hypothetical protein P350_24145 [Burkholderia cepacia JBK9]